MADKDTPDDDFADLYESLPGKTGTPSSETPSSAPSPSRRQSRTSGAERPSADSVALMESASDPESLDELLGGAEASEDRRQRAKDKRKGRIAGWSIFALVLAILGGIAYGGWQFWLANEDAIRSFMGWEEPVDYEAGEAEGEATLTIMPGDTGANISTSLYEAGITKTDQVFYDYLVSTGQNPTFQPGVYLLQQKMTAADALSALEDPETRQDNTVVIPEGTAAADIYALVAEVTEIPLEDLEEAAADPAAFGVDADSLEGWLFPATYSFDPGTTATDVIQTMVDRTRQALEEAGVPDDQAEEILTIASIIQREARFEDDFYKVSRVIQNRLDPDNDQTHGLLQMDSTAQYGYGETHSGSASTSAEALEDDNAWNTYVHKGLPAGPIANPGDLAIDAAMNPADGPWLYFVTVNLDTGETVFSETMEEHEEAIEQWETWCQENRSGETC